VTKTKRFRCPAVAPPFLFPSSTLLLFPSFPIFEGGKKEKKYYFSILLSVKRRKSDRIIIFISFFKPPTISFLSTHATTSKKKKKAQQPPFFLSPSFAAQLLPPPPPSSRRTDRLTGQTAEAAVAVVVRNQNREGNWQANLNVGPFSFFNVVAKAIRRKEKKEETYGHVENEILYMLMKTEREGGGEEKKRINSFLPAKDSAEEGGVEAFGRREASLDFADRHLVLGCGRQERQAAGHRAEHVRWRNWARQQHIFCFVLLFSFKQPNEK
jgi:hypothetical protein